MPACAVSPRFPPEECSSDQTPSITTHNLKIQQHVQVAADVFSFVFARAFWNRAMLTLIPVYNPSPCNNQATELMTLQNLLECCSSLCKVVTQLETPLGKGKLSLHRVSRIVSRIASEQLAACNQQTDTLNFVFHN